MITIGKRFSLSVPVLIACLLLGALSQAVAENNLLINSAFDQGTNAWVLQCIKGAQASMDIVHNDGQSNAIHITVTQPGQMRYFIQLIQKNIKLSANKTYRLKFRARSEPESQIVIVILPGKQPTEKLWQQDQILLDKEWKDYSYDLSLTADEDVASLALSGLAKQAGDYFFSDLSLSEVSK